MIALIELRPGDIYKRRCVVHDGLSLDYKVIQPVLFSAMSTFSFSACRWLVTVTKMFNNYAPGLYHRQIEEKPRPEHYTSRPNFV